MTHPTVSMIDLYRTMARIRAFELAAEVASQGGVGVLGAQVDERAKVRGPLHLSIGQEGVAAGVCAHLSRNDLLTSTHRGHGHCIAKGCDINAMMAELGGRLARLDLRRQVKDIGTQSRALESAGGSIQARDESAWAQLAQALEKAGLNLVDTKGDKLRERMFAAGFREPSAPKIFTMVRLGMVFILPRAVVPSNYQTSLTFFIYAILLLGGAATVFGPIIGSVIFWVLLSFFSGFIARAVEVGWLPFLTNVQAGQLRVVGGAFRLRLERLFPAVDRLLQRPEIQAQFIRSQAEEGVDRGKAHGLIFIIEHRSEQQAALRAGHQCSDAGPSNAN
mgnify:CR=1 FL=1